MSALKQRTNFTLSHSVKSELEEMVPKRKRSQFVERAIARALIEEARRKALDAIDTAPHYSTGGRDSVELLRQIRLERTGTLVDRHGGS